MRFDDLIFGGPKWRHPVTLLVLLAGTWAAIEVECVWGLVVGYLLSWCQLVITFITFCGQIRFGLPRWMCNCECDCSKHRSHEH